jgi:predicted NBD/HSP70 family sugar kinase
MRCLVDNDVNMAALGRQHGHREGHPELRVHHVGAGSAPRSSSTAGWCGSCGLAGEIGYLPSRSDVPGRRHGLARVVADFGLGPPPP